MLLVLGGLSSVFKSARDQQGKATGKKGQQWPGPVAGQPPRPRQAQRRPAQPHPAQPARPAQPPWPGQPWPQGQTQQDAPWPQSAGPYHPPGWPGGSPAPQPDRWAGEGVGTEGVGTEGRSSEGVRSEGMRSEGRSSEGTRTEGERSEGINTGVSSSVGEERARFREERAAFRQSRQEGGLHRFGQTAEAEPQPSGQAANPVAAMVASREGLAQAVLVAEVLGKPRALRPYGRR